MQRPFRTRIVEPLRRCRLDAFGDFPSPRRLNRLNERGKEFRPLVPQLSVLAMVLRACNGICRKSGILKADAQARAASRQPPGIRETRYSQYVRVIECAIAR